jgi:hypothetical protein
VVVWVLQEFGLAAVKYLEGATLRRLIDTTSDWKVIRGIPGNGKERQQKSAVRFHRLSAQ